MMPDSVRNYRGAVSLSNSAVTLLEKEAYRQAEEVFRDATLLLERRATSSGMSPLAGGRGSNTATPNISSSGSCSDHIECCFCHSRSRQQRQLEHDSSSLHHMLQRAAHAVSHPVVGKVPAMAVTPECVILHDDDLLSQQSVMQYGPSASMVFPVRLCYTAIHHNYHGSNFYAFSSQQQQEQLLQIPSQMHSTPHRCIQRTEQAGAEESQRPPSSVDDRIAEELDWDFTAALIRYNTAIAYTCSSRIAASSQRRKTLLKQALKQLLRAHKAIIDLHVKSSISSGSPFARPEDLVYDASSDFDSFRRSRLLLAGGLVMVSLFGVLKELDRCQDAENALQTLDRLHTAVNEVCHNEAEALLLGLVQRAIVAAAAA